MASPRRRGAPVFLIGIWMFNLFGLIGLLAILAFQLRRPPADTPLDATQTPPRAGMPVDDPPAGIYYLPTVTPNPHSTPIPATTPTRILMLDLGMEPVIIGYSVSARPLEVYKFGNGENERMIVAGIHGGNEWNTIALAEELIIHLNEHPETVPSDITLYILRNLNPDGEARAHTVDGRVNDHGVDLNRNWPSAWQAEWSRDGCWDYLPTSGGDHAGSEPETMALINFINSHHIDALISYHSAALGIFPGGRPPDEASVSLAKAAAKVSKYPYPPIDTGCIYTGNLADWASEQGIAAIDIELTNHRDTDFDVNLKILTALLNWRG